MEVAFGVEIGDKLTDEGVVVKIPRRLSSDAFDVLEAKVGGEDARAKNMIICGSEGDFGGSVFRGEFLDEPPRELEVLERGLRTRFWEDLGRGEVFVEEVILH